MPRSKKQKIEPVLISSREGATAVVADIIQDKLRVAAIHVEIEEAKAAIERQHHDELDALNRKIQSAEGGLQVWSLKHPEEFGKNKSIDLPMARFGFRTSPPKVEKEKAATWEVIVTRLLATQIRDQSGEHIIFDGADYVRYPDPQPAKDKLLADRDSIPEEALRLAGIRFEQDEVFFIEPKSQVLDESKREVA